MAENYTEVINENQEEIDIVELKDDNGRVLKFFHIGTIEHKERWYAFFQPAEEIEGLEMEEVVIFEIVGEEGQENLAPVMDENLLDEVYQAFIAEMEDDEDYDDEEEHHCRCHEEGHECDCDGDCDCDEDDHECKCHEEGHKCKCGHHDED